MDYRPSEIKAGLLILVAIALAVVLLGLLGNWDAWFTERAVLRMDFDSISGLQVDGEVHYAGYPIGRVVSSRFVEATLEPDELRRLSATDEEFAEHLGRLGLTAAEFAAELARAGFSQARVDALAAAYAPSGKPAPTVTKVRVIAEVDRRQSFRAGDRAIINQNLTGKTIVDIKPGLGEPLTALDDPDYPKRLCYAIATRPTVTMADLTWDARQTIDEFRREGRPMIAHANKIVEEAAATMTTVRSMVDENREPIQQTIANVNTSTARVATLAEAGEFDALIKSARSATELAQTLLDENRKHIDAFLAKLPEIGGNVEGATAEIKQFVEGEQFKKLVAQVEAALESSAEMLGAENRVTVRGALAELRQGMQALNQGLQEIERNPWKLFYRPKPEELVGEHYYMAAQALQRGAENLAQIVQVLNEMGKEGTLDPGSERVQELMNQARQLLERIGERERTLWDKAQERKR